MRSYVLWAFPDLVRHLEGMFVDKSTVAPSTRWQGLDVSDRPEMTPYELLNVSIELAMPETELIAQHVFEPNLPWAEDHFQERVSGHPLNPPPSHAYWPFNRNKNQDFTKQEKFSHTYPERFWPKMANEGETRPNGRQVFVPHNGIRYEYGDLMDVVVQMARDPFTRQAYLPVWFPEDTGAHHGERVPCTLGYHFMVRDNAFHVTYFIRSCDFMRHFKDDVYLAVRLAQWMRDMVDRHPKHHGERYRMGNLLMHVGSFHVFEGDLPILRSRLG